MAAVALARPTVLFPPLGATSEEACACRGAHFRRYRKELRSLPAPAGSPLEATLARRPCEAVGLPPSNGTVRCLVGRLAKLILCSQASLAQRDPASMLTYWERINTLMPFAGSCLHDGSWSISAAEVYDNYRNAVRILGNHLTPDEGEREGFFVEPLSEESWAKRVTEKQSEFLEELRWRRSVQEESKAVDFNQRATYTAAAPPNVAASQASSGTDRDEPCGMNAISDKPSDQTESQPAKWQSRARLLSDSGCVWLLENACIEDRRIIMFGSGTEARMLPRTLIGCGEFGNYEFTAIDVRHPRRRHQLAQNVSMPDTLLVVPGLMSGVSAHNPFHLLHSTVPATWQLHHPSYRLCVPRNELDVRLAFISGFHGRRQSHFWQVFTSKRKQDAESLQQQFSIAAAWRFWWGPLVDHPPIPLGTDPTPRCYRRIIFGRELFRTGLGGFVTPRVFSFYRRYIDAAFATAEGENSSWKASVEGGTRADGAAEWAAFDHMRPGSARVAGDVLALAELRRTHRADFFAADGSGLTALQQLPSRLWKAALDGGQDSAAVEQKSTEPALGPDDNVATALVLSRAEAASPQRWLRVVFVQRPKRAGRWVANLADVLQWVEGFRHPSVRLSLITADFEKLHPATQWQLASQAHILVGVTGAALAWAAFQPRGGVVLDIFPPGSNFCAEGWGRNRVSHYGGLARLAGVQHTCMQHPVELQGPARAEGDAGHWARVEVRERLGGFWHGQNVRLDMPKFKQYFREGVDRVLAAIPHA